MSNLLCEKRLQNCLYDFSMNEILDVVKDLQIIKFHNKNNFHSSQNKLLYGFDLSTLNKCNIPSLINRTEEIIYGVNLKLNLLNTITTDDGNFRHYFKNNIFKIQSNDINFYHLFCKKRRNG